MEYILRLCLTGKNTDFLLNFFYIKYYLPVLTMFLDE